MVEVKLWGALSASLGSDTGRVDIEAKTIGELLKKLVEEYPGVEPYMTRGISVSIDGVIYRDNWTKELPEGAEIYLLPRMAGG